ncbi:MAG TPA: tetratricopeptide repeat protein, partial [Bacteroidota bacterium]|nr:tetratricopeptide repeat protein [Bacteroidota bacterium]
MKCLSAILFAIMLFVARSHAEAPSHEAIERIRNLSIEGLNHAYNFEFDSATHSFDLASQIEPLHPRPYVGKVMILCWKVLLNRNEREVEAFSSLADRVVDAAEKYEERYGNDADARLCLGTIYGYRAFVHGRTKSYLKAAWDAKKSYDLFHEALNLDERTYDAYMGIGLFHYFLDFLPKPLQWIASLMGVSADAVSGIKEIRIAAEKGFFNKVEAQYYLAQFLPWMEGDFESGERILAELGSRYPSNSVVAFTRAVWDLGRNDVRSARDLLASIVEARNDSTDPVRAYAMYKLAECYFRLGMYRSARHWYLEFLARHKEETYQATSSYRIGICYEMEEKRDTAMLHYKKAVNGDRKLGDDGYAARKAELRLRSSLHDADTLLLAAQNALRSGMYDAVITFATALKAASGVSSDMILEADFLLAESLFEKKSYADALGTYRTIASRKIEREVWLHPWSHYQSGLCLLKLSDIQGARKEFEKVLEYDEYDFRNWLDFRSKRELEKMEKS